MKIDPYMIMQSSTTCMAILSKRIYSTTHSNYMVHMPNCAKCLQNDHSMSTNILTLKINSEEIHLSFKSYEESGHGVD